MTKTGLEFGILVIVISLIFVICDLEFLFLHYSSTPKEHASVPAKPLNSKPRKVGFSMLKKMVARGLNGNQMIVIVLDPS